jgi:hypothetical protein
VWICSWKVIEVGWLYTRASGSHYFTFVQCWTCDSNTFHLSVYSLMLPCCNGIFFRWIPGTFFHVACFAEWLHLNLFAQYKTFPSRALTAVIRWTSHFQCRFNSWCKCWPPQFTSGRSYFHIIRDSTQDVFCNMDEIQQMRLPGANDSYEGLSKIFRTDAVKIIKLTTRPIGRHHPRSNSLPHVDTGPTVSSIFGTLPGRPFLSECQALWFGLDLLNVIKPASFQLQFHFWK